MDSKWREHMKVVQRADSPERTPTKKKAMKPGWDEQLMEPDKKAEQMKKKAVVGQSPSPSKQKTAAPVQLTRAPISQPAKKPTPTVFQELQLQLAPQVVGLPPEVAPQAEPVPIAEGQPPIAAQQAGLAFPQSPPSRPFRPFRKLTLA